MSYVQINLMLPPKEIQGKTTIFLAGPIQGVNDWQTMFMRHLTQELKPLCVTTANSNLITFDSDYKLPKIINLLNPRRDDMSDFVFDNQVAWESRYLAESEIILFWLNRETEHKCNRAYAQTTRYELGEWMTKVKYVPEFQNKHIVLGFDQGFTGQQYIKTRMIQEHFPNIHTCETLNDCAKICAELLIIK